MMNKQEVSWFSPSLHKDMRIRVYGSGEVPFLVFPTQAAMSDNFENFGMIDALVGDIDSGRIQLFCVDSVDEESWLNLWGDLYGRAQRQEEYYEYIIEEVLPFVRKNNGTGMLPIATGCDLGALHAAIVFLRRPELFGGLLALSGTYDAKFYFGGWSNGTLYDNSPVDSLANISPDHEYIDIYNEKRIVLCVGQGRWEDEARRTTAIMRDIFDAKGIHGWVDFWGYDVDHDWYWWKKQMVYFLPYVLGDA
ncbi:MAG: esterase family protein [Selenomonadaceae bacterium]|nr:esterase family protein [Selenomonadaceae bacterium]